MKIALKLFILMTILTGLIYPLFITGISQILFSHQANGSLINLNTQTVGSDLIGQTFTGAKYFWGRPSASDYQTMASSGSNLGPTSVTLKKLILERKEKLIKTHPYHPPVPEELLQASGSGLDPHISWQAALYQVKRVAGARQLNEGERVQLNKIMTALKQKAFLSEEEYINVLKLNLALDQMPRE